MPLVALDALFWLPGWCKAPRDEFRAKVCAALDAAHETGWVVEGNYEKRLSDLQGELATDIICEYTRRAVRCCRLLSLCARAGPAAVVLLPSHRRPDV